MVKFFKDIFGDDDPESDERPTYDEAFRRGSCGLTVPVNNDQELDRAAEILNSAGAVDIDERSQQWRNEGWTGGAKPRSGSKGSDALEAGTTRKLQEVEEELQVGKRSVSRGGVRVFSRVIEVPVEETVTLREEHAEVQRRDVDRPATQAELANFKEGAIEVRETGEEAVVAKTARVVGEVEVGKRVTEREETLGDTVRKTKVDVEPIAAGKDSVRTTPKQPKRSK
jgi:stress response protein YsnF